MADHSGTLAALASAAAKPDASTALSVLDALKVCEFAMGVVKVIDIYQGRRSTDWSATEAMMATEDWQGAFAGIKTQMAAGVQRIGQEELERREDRMAEITSRIDVEERYLAEIARLHARIGENIACISAIVRTP